jgi:alcohol dehydrogenase (NADP+)
METDAIFNNRHGREEFALRDTLSELGLDYLDLFLVHWPMGNSTGTTTFDYLPVWPSMEKLVPASPTSPLKGTTRFIGISNFAPPQLEKLLKSATIKPKVHQIELHPYLQQQDFVDLHSKNGITVTAYSPLGNTNPVYSQGYYGKTGNLVTKILSHPTIASIASSRKCTPAQVVLAWNMARKVVVIPKAAQAAHQKENIATPEKCKLADEDIKSINGLEQKSLRVNALPCRDYNFACFEGLKAANCEGCS